MTAVISAGIKKNLSELVNFLQSHFNIDSKRNTQHFHHIMLYYFKKGKNATETQKILVHVWRRCCD